MSSKHSGDRRNASALSEAEPRTHYPASRCNACGEIPRLNPLLGHVVWHHTLRCPIAGRTDGRLAQDVSEALAHPDREGFLRALDPVEVDDLDPYALVLPLPSTAAERAEWQVWVTVWEEAGEQHVMRGYSRLGVPVGVIIDSEVVSR